MAKAFNKVEVKIAILLCVLPDAGFGDQQFAS